MNLRMLFSVCLAAAAALSAVSAEEPATPRLSPPNLIANSSFELGASGFAAVRGLYVYRNPDLKYTPPVLDITTKVHGKASLKLANPCGDYVQLYAPEVRLVPGAEYTLSAWMKSDTPGLSAGLKLRSIKPNSWASLAGAWPLTTEWKRYSVTQRLTRDKQHEYYSVRLEFPLDNADRNKIGSAAGTVWIDALQLSEGPLKEYEPAGTVEAAVEFDRNMPWYEPTEEVAATLRVVDYTETSHPSTIAWMAIDDYFRKTVLESRIPVKTEPGSTVVVSLPLGLKRNGAFTLRGTLVCEGVTTGPMPDAHFAVAKSAAIDSFRDVGMGLGVNEGGCHIHPLNQEPVFDCYNGPLDDSIALQAHYGVRWMRVWGSWPAFEWSFIEPEPGVFKWDAPDRLVEATARQRIRLLPVLGSGFNKAPENQPWGVCLPRWVRDRSKLVDCGWANWAKQGRKTYLPPVEDWKDFIFHVVERYKGKITHYEILNEPNLALTPQDYVTYLKAAYEAAKQADPGCKIVGFCVTGDYQGELTGYLRKCIDLGGLRYADVVSFHPYGYSLESSTPMSATAVNTTVRRFLDDAGARDMPLWDTELYYMTGMQGDAGYQASLYQGHELAQHHLIDLATGIAQSICVTALQNVKCPMLAHQEHGAFQVTAPLPSSHTIIYNTVVRLFEGARLENRVSWPFRNLCLVFKKGGRLTAAVLNYDVSGKPNFVRLGLARRDVRLIDILGNECERDEAALSKAGGTADPNSLYLSLSNNPWYLQCAPGAEDRFVRALEHAEITGEHAVEVVGARLSASGRNRALAVELKNASGDEEAGLIRVLKTPDWLTADMDPRPYVALSPAAAGTSYSPASLKSTGRQQGEVELMVSTKDEAIRHVVPLTAPLAACCMRLAKPPAIDGRFDAAEWAGTEPISINTAGRIVTGDPKSWRGEADCSATVRAGFDDGNLYLAVAVRDNTNGERPTANDLWEGDAVEMFLDLYPDRQLDRSAYTRDTCQIVVSPGTPKSPEPAIIVLGPDAKLKADAVQWKRSVVAGGYQIEMAIPFSALGFKGRPEALGRIGFDVAVDDSDGQRRKLQMAWNGEDDDCRNRFRFGCLSFVGSKGP